ncbi:MAG: J domain-containing protein [Spirochaetes bacterium]|nr:J domain-containing protein [Spirochaetota bacterium]
MTDYEVLEINESFTCDELKKAFRRKCKQFHPDKNNDSMQSHLAMIRLNQAYSNLLNLVKTGDAGKKSEVKDEAYAVYKEGISLFQNIHPSKWKSYSIEGLFNAGAIETHPEALAVIKSLITGMAQAYLKFSIVAAEHETSPWYSDSLKKMKEIEKMTVRYKKIKKSYESEMRAGSR